MANTHYIIDNGGYVNGPHPSYEATMEAAKECRNDPNFKSKGNMAVVQVIALLDNFMENTDIDP